MLDASRTVLLAVTVGVVIVAAAVIAAVVRLVQNIMHAYDDLGDGNDWWL